MKITQMSWWMALGLGLLLGWAGLSAPASAGGGQGHQECATQQAGRCGKCGDGYCATQCGETAASCPKDCGTVEAKACGRCGDGHCTPQCGETAQSCPRDCGVVSQSLLGGVQG